MQNNIKEYRKKAKLTQQQLGEIIDLSRQQISNIERNMSIPSSPTLMKIANALKCNAEDILKP